MAQNVDNTCTLGQVRRRPGICVNVGETERMKRRPYPSRANTRRARVSLPAFCRHVMKAREERGFGIVDEGGAAELYSVQSAVDPFLMGLYDH